MWPWWVKTPNEDFSDEILAIDDTFGDDVRGCDGGDGHGGWEGGQHHGEQISNWWKWENSQKSERVKKRSESSKKVKIVKTVKIVKKNVKIVLEGDLMR